MVRKWAWERMWILPISKSDICSNNEKEISVAFQSIFKYTLKWGVCSIRISRDRSDNNTATSLFQIGYTQFIKGLYIRVLHNVDCTNRFKPCNSYRHLNHPKECSFAIPKIELLPLFSLYKSTQPASAKEIDSAWPNLPKAIANDCPISWHHIQIIKADCERSHNLPESL